VLVKFDVSDSVQLGDRSEASIKTKSLLGAKFLEITPRGDGELSGTIPAERTTAAYELPDALGDLSATSRTEHHTGLRCTGHAGAHVSRYAARFENRGGRCGPFRPDPQPARRRSANCWPTPIKPPPYWLSAVTRW